MYKNKCFGSPLKNFSLLTRVCLVNMHNRRLTDNLGITFIGRPHTSPKLMADSFNRQFTTSKLGKDSSSMRPRQVSKDVMRMSLEEAESFTSDQVTSAIKSCRMNSRSYSLHLKNLEPLATEYLIALTTTPLSPAVFRRSG